MAQQTINLGAAPNDGTGDTLRDGGTKINANFDELYAADVALAGEIDGKLAASANLSDVADVPTARDNLDLGTSDSPQFAGVNVGHASDTTITRVSAGVVAVEGNNLLSTATGIKQGTHTIPIPAAAMVARTTNGAASGTTESTTNKVMTRTLDFDASTDEFAQVSIPMPKSWDEGTVTVQFDWTAGATGNVVWGAQAQYQRDDDPVDGAWGAAQTVTDGVTAAGDRMVSAFTSAITPAGTGGNECSLLVQVYRDADNGSDTLAADAKLLAIRVNYTVNAGDDS